jgi:ribosomal protein L37AE/L43A
MTHSTTKAAVHIWTCSLCDKETQTVSEGMPTGWAAAYADPLRQTHFCDECSDGLYDRLKSSRKAATDKAFAKPIEGTYEGVVPEVGDVIYVNDITQKSHGLCGRVTGLTINLRGLFDVRFTTSGTFINGCAHIVPLSSVITLSPKKAQ